MIQLLLSVVIVLVVFVLSLEYILRQNNHYKAFLKLKGPGPYLPLIGNSWEIALFTAGIFIDRLSISYFFLLMCGFFSPFVIESGFRILREYSNRYKNGYAVFAMGQLYYMINTAENFEVSVF